MNEQDFVSPTQTSEEIAEKIHMLLKGHGLSIHAAACVLLQEAYSLLHYAVKDELSQNDGELEFSHGITLKKSDSNEGAEISARFLIKEVTIDEDYGGEVTEPNPSKILH